MKLQYISILIVFLITSPLLALDIEAVRELNLQALHSNDAEILNAVKILQDRGLLEPSDNPKAPRQEHDCTLIIRQTVLSSALARDLTAQALPPEVTEIAISFEEGGIRLTGKLDGPLFINPSFSAFLGLRMSGANTIDLIIHEAKVSGFGVKWLSGFAFKFIDENLKTTFGTFARVSDLGRQEDKSHLIRIQIRPEGLVPFVGNNAQLSAIEAHNGSLHLMISMRQAHQRQAR
jgi:hypothetical protein